MCETGWYGPACNIQLEASCDDRMDNDQGESVNESNIEALREDENLHLWKLKVGKIMFFGENIYNNFLQNKFCFIENFNF